MKHLKPRFYSAIYNTIVCLALIGICYLFPRVLGSVTSISIPLGISAFLLGFFYSYKALLLPRTSRAHLPAVVGYLTVFYIFLLGGLFSFIQTLLITHHNCTHTSQTCFNSLQDLVFLFLSYESIAVIIAAPASFLGCFSGMLNNWLYHK